MTRIRVLFVCMGNICRSPSAEGSFRKLLEEHDLLHQVEVDSAGTHGYHVGEMADSRSRKAALERGIDLGAHRARQVSVMDFETYHYLLAMDWDNYHTLKALSPSPEHEPKLRLFLEFAPHLAEEEVPDPYYGGPQGFERVLDLVEAAAEGLLADIRSNCLAQPELP